MSMFVKEIVYNFHLDAQNAIISIMIVIMCWSTYSAISKDAGRKYVRYAEPKNLHTMTLMTILIKFLIGTL